MPDLSIEPAVVPCPICGAAIISGSVPHHLSSTHGPRKHLGRFPLDAVLNIGAGKTGYVLKRGTLDGDPDSDVVLESVTSGREQRAISKNVRWDGKTYCRYSRFTYITYTEITSGESA